MYPLPCFCYRTVSFVYRGSNASALCYTIVDLVGGIRNGYCILLILHSFSLDQVPRSMEIMYISTYGCIHRMVLIQSHNPSSSTYQSVPSFSVLVPLSSRFHVRVQAASASVYIVLMKCIQV